VKAQPGVPRNSLQLILDPEFGSALVGKVILVTAFWAQTMLLVVLTFQQTGSAASVGAVTAAQLLPQLALALVSGGMADKRGPQIPVVSGGICTGLGCIGLALWLATPDTAGAIPVQVPLLIASTVCGIGIALASAAIQAVPPRLSSPSERSAAMSLNFLPTALARTLGPIGATLLAFALGTIPTLAIVGASCLAASCIFMAIRRLGTPGHEMMPLNGLRDVLAYLRTDKPLLGVLAAVAALGAGSEAAVTLAPSMGNMLGIGASGAGWVTAAFGVGGLVGVVGFRVSTRFFRPENIGCCSMILLGGSMASVGLAPSLPFATALLVVGGASMVMGVTGFSIVAQQRSPAPFLGRVMALWVMAFTGVRPLAGIVLGFASDHASTATALVGTGVITVLASGVVYLWVRGCRGDDQPALI
jgi:predicted MFS family arabinose efflux permease